MHVTAFLADHAQVADGKLNVIGAGWTHTNAGQEALPFAIGLIVEVDYNETNLGWTIELRLLDEDGRPGGPSGNDHVITQPELKFGRPPNLKSGERQRASFALNHGPAAWLKPDHGYVWEVRLNDRLEQRLGFRTRPAR